MLFFTLGLLHHLLFSDEWVLFYTPLIYIMMSYICHTNYFFQVYWTFYCVILFALEWLFVVCSCTFVCILAVYLAIVVSFSYIVHFCIILAIIEYFLSFNPWFPLWFTFVSFENNIILNEITLPTLNQILLRVCS